MELSLPITYALAVLNSTLSGIFTEYYISKKKKLLIMKVIIYIHKISSTKYKITIKIN